MRNILLIIILILLQISCQRKYDVIKTQIERIDTSGIYISYGYGDSIYDFRFPIELPTREILYEDDSIIIRVKSTNPQIATFVSKIQQVKTIDEKTISLKATDYSIYNYHSVDEKPIFGNLLHSEQNDSAITSYFSFALNRLDGIEKDGLYLLIDGSGNPRFESSYIMDEEYLDRVKSVIRNMPKFSPAIHRGDTVTVKYLVEILVP